MKPFPWRPRMRAKVHLGGFVTVIVVRDRMALCSWAEGPDGAEQPRSAWFRYDLLEPDLTADSATAGAFLQALQEEWNEPRIQCQPYDGSWAVTAPPTKGARGLEGMLEKILGQGPTAGRALLAAWNART